MARKRSVWRLFDFRNKQNLNLVFLEVAAIISESILSIEASRALAITMWLVKIFRVRVCLNCFGCSFASLCHVNFLDLLLWMECEIDAHQLSERKRNSRLLQWRCLCCYSDLVIILLRNNEWQFKLFNKQSHSAELELTGWSGALWDWILMKFADRQNIIKVGD